MKKPIPFGKYYLLERINVGGMAEVFRAKAYGVEGFERLIAVKRILPNIAEDHDFITMFIDEAKIAVQLNHANIAQIFDLGKFDNAYYIALEHVHGRDLRAIFERCRHRADPMPVAQACFVVMKMCEGLDYAHNKRDASGRDMNLVHRDVSPQNVLVSFDGEVKLVDFGIAKAAGKVGKTQAGILKGKFGYMSPEQVRGLPIDRRSDIFSMGIVLYEMLTGERLFVGESDFSTLEKVRNVEILPPTTYNRRIPDELERIVLKALAKDVDDRYQNAIDLHDELQAFVYTAGEFCSRKELAGWMKKTFAREIAEETAKLEQYRQVPPPDAGPAAGARYSAYPAAGEARRTTQALPASSPPPVPAQALAGGNGRAARKTVPPVPVPAPAPLVLPGARAKAEQDLEWDDEEVETQIYDSPGGGERKAAPGILDEDAADWPEATSGRHEGDRGAPVARADAAALGSPAVRTLGAPAPIAAGPAASLAAASTSADPSAVLALASQHFPIVDTAPAPPFPSPPALASPSSRAFVWGIVIVGLVVLMAGGGVIYWVLGDTARPVAGHTAIYVPPQPAPTLAPPAAGTPPPPAAVVTPAPGDTGIDVITEPAGRGVKLDGRPVAELTPLRLRGLAPGAHLIEIDAPVGYQAARREVVVLLGRTEVVTVKLETSEVLASFASEPAGATVTLVANGVRRVIGVAPASARLDPLVRHEVVFEKEGHVAVTKPVAFTGATEVAVVAVLERAPLAVTPLPAEPPPREATRRPSARESERREPPARVAAADPRPSSAREPAAREPEPSQPPARAPASHEPAATSPDAAGTGRLSIGAKPPCAVYINGSDTGRQTPLRDYEVKAGSVTITLVNNEFNIRERFTVMVKPGETTKVIKDFSDRLAP